MGRFFAVVLGFLMLSGCATTTPYINPLSADVRETLFVQSIEIDTSQLKATDSAGDLELRTLMAEEIKRQLDEKFRNRPSGSKPAKMVVNLTKDDSSWLEADVDVIDVATGQEIVTYDVKATVQRSGFMKMAQGKNSKVGQVVTVFSNRLAYLFLD